MKYYYLMSDPRDNINTIMTSVGELYGVDVYEVQEGKYIDNWDNRITLEYDPEEGNIPEDYLYCNVSWMLMSSKFKELCDGMGIDYIQYMPIKVKNIRTNEFLEGYSLANVCRFVNAFDYEKSSYIVYKDDEGIDEDDMTITKFAFKREKLENLDIFKIPESNLSVFVSERFKKMIEENKLTGFYFMEVKVI